MARKSPRKSPRKKAARTAKKVASSRKPQRAIKPALGVLRAKVAGTKPPPAPWTAAEVREAFRRFRAAQPEPRGELEHVDPYTLLIAVVLSAQATDAGVNKATPALFAAANTPAKMVALGEAKVADYIKTIGLFRTKATNVIALSR